jgi:twinkle protein|tara:strand:+ start:1162 stop:2133 length:972 start_codon:yes stop_codon:yes gene_type:complete
MSVDLRITPDLYEYMEPMDVEGHVFSPNNFREETLEWIENRNNMSGCRLPCLKDTDLRIIPGTLLIWAGVNGHGKSALVQQFCLWWAAGKYTDKEEKVLFWSPEMAFRVQIERMVKQTLGVGAPTIQAASYVIDYLHNKVFIYGKEEHVRANEIIALARWAAANGFTHLVIDSLMMVDLQTDQANLNLGQKNFVRMLKEAARTTGLHIHLVAHMRKGDSEERMGDKMDIKGSGEITDLADYAFIVHKDIVKQKKLNKDPDDEEYLRKPDGYLNCVKNRYDPEHPTLALWFSGKPFSFKGSRRTDTPKLINPTREELERGFIPE